MKKKLITISTIAILILICAICVLIDAKRGEKKVDVESEYLITEPIKKISIRYYPGYNIGTGEAINFIDEVKFELTGKDKEKAQEFFSKIKQTDYNFDECDCVYMTDAYEIYINDKIKVGMGTEFGAIGDNTFDVPKEINNYMSMIISKYNAQYLQKSITSNKVTIEYEGKRMVLEDEDDIKAILSYKYIPGHEDEDYRTFDGGPKGSVILDNNVTIYLYGYICYVKDGDNSTYAIFGSYDQGDLLDTVKKIMNNDDLRIKNKIKTDTIKVEYKNQEFTVNEQEVVDKIYNELIDLEYRDFNYLENMSEENFDTDDIKITINRCKYYIPGDTGYASRFFVDENGKLYDVSYLINTYTEKYIKELIGYTED